MMRSCALWLSFIFSIFIFSYLFLLLPYLCVAGDDLLGAKEVVEKGFWGMNAFIFLSWDARYTATFLSSLFFYWTGLAAYGLSAFCLIIATMGAFFLLFTRLAPKEYSYWKLFNFTLIFWVSYWLIAKPDAIGGADFVLVGQFLYRAGSYCYQTSLILVALIISFVIDFYKTTSSLYRRILWGLIIISLVLLVGTNEGTTVMLFLVSFYGLYKNLLSPNPSGNSEHINLWMVMCFILGGLLTWMILGSGDQARILYYQIKPHLFPMDHDWVYAISMGLSQTLFLMVYFLLNPVIWFLTWLLYPELLGFLKNRSTWIPEQDLWVMILGLIFVGFFSDAWSMGCFAPPRYYGVMATLGFFMSLGLCVNFCEWIKKYFKFLNNFSEHFFAYLGLLIASVSLVLMIIFNSLFIPVLSELPMALSGGPAFVNAYQNIVKKLEQAQAKHENQIVLTSKEFLPSVPLLDYFIAIPSSRFEGKVPFKERRQSLADDLAFYYGVKEVKISN